jgi:hypothetical protein
MTFTQNSDIYIAVQDAGINRVINHVMLQRLSLFNYGSILPVTNPRPVCRDIRTVPQVVQANNPLITSMSPFPVIQTPLTLDYIAQLTKGAVDFFPGNAFTLPPELNPPLKNQQFAVNFEICAGLVCPLSTFPPRRERREIDCFCLNLFATGGCGITGIPGKQTISMNVSGIEIPELKPDSMETAIECYALLALNRGILPKIGDAISSLVFNSIQLPDSIGIDIPKFCVGGNDVCVLPPWPSCDVPLVGCGKCVTLPSFCFFEDRPDITIPIDLSGLITSEVSFSARLETFYGVGSGVPNRWQIVAVPTLPLDLDIIDIADTVGDLFKNLVQGAIDNLLKSVGAPDWAIALIDGILGGIDHIIREILDIPDDIGEWLIDMISQIGIFKSLLNDLYDYIAVKIPAALEIEDPFQVLEKDGILIPVKIPIEFIGVNVNSHEIVIEGDVGN